MAAEHDVDLLIIGAGCAGLSLARGLARRKARLRTLIIDPRTDYEDDRTWCFWQRAHHPFRHLVSRSWGQWRFSAAGQSVTQLSCNGVQYHCLRSIDFYNDAIEKIRASAAVELAGGVCAQSVQPRGPVAEAATSSGTVRARFVVDTRPPGLDSFDSTPMQQVFAGAEVVTDRDVFDPGVVGLMDNMTADEFGFRFTYVLPFAERHALVEETRFTDLPVTTDVLGNGLHRTLDALDASADVVRTESGRLPMAPIRTANTEYPNIATAGVGGGAVRPSTGYAFLRIQQWASDCADRLAGGGLPLGHSPEPPWRAAMDSLFLRVLRAQPELGPRMFLALGKHVSTGTLVRFLSDECRPADFLRVAGALPKAPFLRQLARKAWASGS